jgi:hypothetical protein
MDVIVLPPIDIYIAIFLWQTPQAVATKRELLFRPQFERCSVSFSIRLRFAEPFKLCLSFYNYSFLQRGEKVTSDAGLDVEVSQRETEK